MLSLIKRIFARLRIRSSAHRPFDGKSYWEARAQQYGRRAVLNLAYAESEFDHATDSQKKTLLPLFSQQLTGSERKILDFGCGVGRFTEDLAKSIGGCAVGVDVSDKLIRLARPAANVTFRTIRSGVIPGDSAEFDALWICLVLGGIPERELKNTVNRLEELLKPGGLLFLVENTSQKPDGSYWFFRTASYYQFLFPSISLRLISTYTDVGEEMSVLAGRKEI